MIYAGLHYGCAGAVASCANVAPRLVADIYDKFVDGDWAGALAAQFRLSPLRIACSMGTFPQVIKEGLELQGIPVGSCLEPIQRLKSEEREKLRQVLSDMGLVARGQIQWGAAHQGRSPSRCEAPNHFLPGRVSIGGEIW